MRGPQISGAADWPRLSPDDLPKLSATCSECGEVFVAPGDAQWDSEQWCKCGYSGLRVSPQRPAPIGSTRRRPGATNDLRGQRGTVALYPASSISLRIFSAVRAELAPFKQRDVADVLGITESRVSQLLAGGQNWTLDTVTRLLMAAEKLNRNVKS